MICALFNKKIIMRCFIFFVFYLLINPSFADMKVEDFSKNFSGEYYLCTENGRARDERGESSSVLKIDGKNGDLVIYSRFGTKSWKIDAEERVTQRQLNFIDSIGYADSKNSYSKNIPIPDSLNIPDGSDILWVSDSYREPVYSIVYSPSGFSLSGEDYSNVKFLMFGARGGMMVLGTDKLDCPASYSKKHDKNNIDGTNEAAENNKQFEESYESLIHALLASARRNDLVSYKKDVVEVDTLRRSNNRSSKSIEEYMEPELLQEAAFHGSREVLDYQISRLEPDQRTRLLNAALVNLPGKCGDCDKYPENETKESSTVRSYAYSKLVSPTDTSLWLSVWQCQSQVLKHWISIGVKTNSSWAQEKSKVAEALRRDASKIEFACAGPKQDLMRKLAFSIGLQF